MLIRSSKKNYLAVIQRLEHSTLWSSRIKGLVWFRPNSRGQPGMVRSPFQPDSKLRFLFESEKVFFPYLLPGLDKSEYSDTLKKPRY